MVAVGEVAPVAVAESDSPVRDDSNQGIWMTGEFIGCTRPDRVGGSALDTGYFLLN